MTAGPDSAPLTKTPCGDGCRPGWLGAPTKLGKRPKGSLFLVILPKSRTGIGLLGDSKKWGLGPIEADYRRRRPILQIQHHQRFHRAPRSLPDSGGLVLDAGAEQDRRWGKAMREPACACARLSPGTGTQRQSGRWRWYCVPGNGGRHYLQNTAALSRAGFHGAEAVEETKPALVKTLRHALTLTDCVLVHNSSPYTSKANVPCAVWCFCPAWPPTLFLKSNDHQSTLQLAREQTPWMTRPQPAKISSSTHTMLPYTHSTPP